MQKSFEYDINSGLEVYERITAEGEEAMGRMGFPPAQRPRNDDGSLADRPTLPQRVSVLSMSELQDFLAYFTSWHSYAIEMLPDAACEKNAAEVARDFVWAKIRKGMEGTVQDKNDRTRTDQRFIDANARYETCFYKHGKIKSICDALEREIDTLSRAITALEQRTKVEGAQVSGERRGYKMRSGPNIQNVMASFRRKKT